jgi:2-dehydropantoate 2-reductase
VYTVIEQTAENYSSMHQDIAAQRQTEVDYINGYIAQEGLKKGIDVSVNASMVAQIKQRNG